MDTAAQLLVLTLAAGTPLVYAALGELVTEKSGVLNLGVEGMMLVGAVVAFIVAATTKSPWLGVVRRDARRRGALRAVRGRHADAAGEPGGVGARACRSSASGSPRSSASTT